MDNNIEKTGRVTVIGGGAAGMMAAIRAAECGADVTLIERNSFCGKKLKITGKGRCNVTNACDAREFLNHVPTNPRFLYSALSCFSTEDTMAFFEGQGVPLKVERGRRVFPVSDKAEDIVFALYSRVKSAGVKIITGRVSGLLVENGKIGGCFVDEKLIEADAVIIATGGRSYPGTGSDGDGYRFAVEAGHTVTPLIPSLVPLTSKSKICPSLQGLSLKNVALHIVDVKSGKAVYDDFGEMMFTHFGVTGPMVLSASAHLDGMASGKYDAVIDLKPALDEKELDMRIISDFSKYANKDFINALGDLLPSKLIPVVVTLSGIDGRKKVNSVTREERASLCSVLKGLRIRIDGFRPIAEAIVTKGGVDVKEINPKTMQSKLCRGLFFAGEVIDVDAYTGGYNLQIAFSTGVLAGENAAYFSFDN